MPRRLSLLGIVLPVFITASSADAAPDLRVESCKLRADTCGLGGPGNLNSFPDPGEATSFTVTLTNMGPDDATGVDITVTSVTTGVTMTQSASAFGTVASLASATGNPPIGFDLMTSVPCGTNLSFNINITSAQGNFSGSCDLAVPVACTVCINGPFLNLESCNTRSDVCTLGGLGNGDGNADPGENVAMQLAVTNRGLRDATNVNAVVSTTTPGINITQSMVPFGTIPAAGASSPMTTVNYSVATSVPCGTNIAFDVAFTSDQGPLNENCAILVPVACIPCVSAPLVRVASCQTRTDTCTLGLGGANGTAEPGETIGMSLEATNLGIGDATGVTATVTSATSGVTITQPNTTFGTIMALAAVVGTPTIDYTVAPTVACGTDLVFDVAFASAQGNFNDSCTVTVPLPCVPCAALSGQCGLTGDDCASGGPGDGNSQIEPGEDGLLQIRASNQLAVAANSAMATVSSTTPGVIITQPNTSFGTIPGMGSMVGTPDIGFRVASSVACGTDLVFEIAFTSDQGTSTSTCVETIPAPCNACVSTGCLAPNLDLPTALRGIKVGGNPRFQWTADPTVPPEYHLNVVTDKRFLTETDPDSPRLAPTGMGETKCIAATPATTCDDTSADSRLILYYRALSACDVTGADEGRVCPLARPCP